MPKKLAGVKVPKAMRQSKSLSTLLNSGLGREILADALIAAAGAAAAALTRTRPVQKAGRAAAETGSDAASATSDAVQTAAGAVASVVTEAARNFLPTSPRRRRRARPQNPATCIGRPITANASAPARAREAPSASSD